MSSKERKPSGVSVDVRPRKPSPSTVRRTARMVFLQQSQPAKRNARKWMLLIMVLPLEFAAGLTQGWSTLTS